jgi:5-methylcytosine-specific restriction endonuclease McrA
MQPPHFTGIPNLDWIILGVGFVIALHWLRALRLAREGVRLFLLNLVKAGIVFLVSLVVLTALRVQLEPKPSLGISGVIAFLFFLRWQGTKRSRYIPKATKRAVTKRYAEETGEKYDPKKHHIDHRWPHSRGGSNTEDNLRVIERGKNLKKGAKRPKLRDMW